MRRRLRLGELLLLSLLVVLLLWLLPRFACLRRGDRIPMLLIIPRRVLVRRREGGSSTDVGVELLLVVVDPWFVLLFLFPVPLRCRLTTSDSFPSSTSVDSIATRGTR